MFPALMNQIDDIHYRHHHHNGHMAAKLWPSLVLYYVSRQNGRCMLDDGAPATTLFGGESPNIASVPSYRSCAVLRLVLLAQTPDGGGMDEAFGCIRAGA